MALPLSYHWRSLFARRAMTVATVLIIAAVVAVLAWMVSFAAAVRSSLAVASDDRTIVVLTRGATAESNSALPPAEVGKLAQVPDLARDPATGEALLSAEAVTQVTLPRRRDGGRSTANLAVRGVTPVAFAVHRNIRLLGRNFTPGVPEVIVGVAAARQFAGLDVGQRIRLGFAGDREFEIVGHFAADGGPMESEIWCYLPTLMNVYNRTLYSSAYLRVRDGADVAATLARIDGPAIQLGGLTERKYWEDQTRTARAYLGIAGALVAVMATAAVLAIANTMFASVAGRTGEIAMLRTIGFGRGRVLTGFVVEAALLSTLGGVLGCLACAGWLAAVGGAKDVFGANPLAVLAFDIRMTPWIVSICMGSVVLMGVVGALVPAYRASRVAVTSVLREA